MGTALLTRVARCSALLVTALVVGCSSLPPYIGGGSGDSLGGGLVSEEGSYLVPIGAGEQGTFLIVGSDLELCRGDERVVLAGAVPEDGLRFGEAPDDGGVRFVLVGDKVATWYRGSVQVGGRWHRLTGGGGQRVLVATDREPVIRGLLAHDSSFFYERAWMIADGPDLILPRLSADLVLRGVVPPSGLEFAIVDPFAPEVHFPLPNGEIAVWLRDQLRVGNEIVTFDR